MADSHTIGRPTLMTPETLRRLDEAFMLGCSDLEACLFADISKSTLYNYQNDNPEFVERKEKLKENPILTARTSVLKNLSTNPELALKFLERRKKDEFGLRQLGDSENPLNIIGTLKWKDDQSTS
jgi:hypothetical protein